MNNQVKQCNLQVSDSVIRRLAQKTGYYVPKSRKLYFRTDDQGQYCLLDAVYGLPAFGYYHDASLEQIAVWLKDKPDASS